MIKAQKIRFAVTPPASALTEAAFEPYLERCEALGFDTLWLSDIPLGTQGDPLLHLTYAAARTRRLKLGANIVPLGRNPLWLAKQLAQLDRLSNGRLLLSFVPGLGTAPERLALGHGQGDRGAELERILTMLRRWWAGEAVTGDCLGAHFEALRLEPRPLQQPLEVWLGGKGPLALERVARAADGWLTSVVKPEEARLARETIERRTAELGRHIDPEHFGISVPVARSAPPEAAVGALRARREDHDLTDIVAVGTAKLRALIAAHLDAGLSKFVLRPSTALDPSVDWRDDLEWMADAVLDLQR
ncbi:MAG: LLM class flavin-dependent oxidoreductase [Gammaproteobacteria bacterium]|nr:LLM class flavin-dependent oxidoreductase [Gammaproteobacteria bacterium]